MIKFKRFTVSLFLFFCFFFHDGLLQASPLPHREAYYGEQIITFSASKSLKDKLYQILNQTHYPQEGTYDELEPLPPLNIFRFPLRSCLPDRPCYFHTPLTYQEARRAILGRLFLIAPSSLFDVYCETMLTEKDFPSDNKPGFNHLPDASVINVEHTWPQSRFSRSPSVAKIQKSDLHHLFPVASWMNSTRSNIPYGNLSVNHALERCPSSRIGQDSSTGKKLFTPPPNHQGNVARAMFYFSVKYRQVIDSVQELTLRRWHLQDPVDPQEIKQMEQIFTIQRTRNPFIDYPELVGSIQDF
jgi:deoxyribonuclease-1